MTPVAFLVILLAAADPPADAEPVLADRPLSAWVRDLGSANPLLREQALEVLAQSGIQARKACAAIRPLLKDARPPVRVRAAAALWKIEGDAQTLVPVLLEASRDSGLHTRLLILDVASQLGPGAKDLAPALVDFLADTDPNVRRLAVQRLVLLDKNALPALIGGLKQKAPEVKLPVLELLSGLGPRAAESGPAIRALLQDASPQTRIAAARALWRINKDTKTALPALLEMARDPGDETRRQAYQILFELKPAPREMLPAMEAALKEKDVFLQVRAAALVWEISGRTKDALPVLLEGLKDQTNPGRRMLARNTLTQMGAAAKEIVPAVIELARKSPSPISLYDAGDILSRMGDEALKPMEELLGSPEPSLRRMAISTLNALGDKGLPALARALPRMEGNEARQICHYLGRPSAPAAAVLALAGTMKGKNLTDAQHALSALQQIGPRAEAALPAALEVFKDPERPQALRARIPGLIGWLGPAGKPAVPALIEILADAKLPDWQREQTAGGLGQIGPAARASIAALLDARAPGPANVRIRAIEAVWFIDPADERIAPLLIELLKATEVRKATEYHRAVTLLGYLGPGGRTAVPLLAERLREKGPSPQKRGYLIALSNIGPDAKEAIPALKEQLGEGSLPHLVDIANTLIHIGSVDKAALAPLVRAIQERHPASQGLALQAVARLGPAGAGAAEALLGAWKTEREPNQRIRLAQILVSVSPAAAREMLPWLREQIAPDRGFGVKAAAVLWQLDPKGSEGQAHLLRLLGDKEYLARHSLFDAFGQIGPAAREALPGLEEGLKAEPDPKAAPEVRASQEGLMLSTRVSAASALYRVDPKKADRAVATLIEILRSEEPVRPAYRVMAADALGTIGPDARAALPALAELFRKAEPFTRTKILRAVRKIDASAVALLSRP